MKWASRIIGENPQQLLARVDEIEKQREDASKELAKKISKNCTLRIAGGEQILVPKVEIITEKNKDLLQIRWKGDWSHVNDTEARIILGIEHESGGPETISKSGKVKLKQPDDKFPPRFASIVRQLNRRGHECTIDGTTLTFPLTNGKGNVLDAFEAVFQDLEKVRKIVGSFNKGQSLSTPQKRH